MTDINVQFHEEDWARLEEAWAAWWAGELERPLVMIEDLEPPPGVHIANTHDLGPAASSFDKASFDKPGSKFAPPLPLRGQFAQV